MVRHGPKISSGRTRTAKQLFAENDIPESILPQSLYFHTQKSEDR